MEDNLLDIRHLVAAFPSESGEVAAIDDVSFSIDHGETVGVVGESGCGKTVTSLCIVRLIEKSGGRIAGGEILFKGEDLARKSVREMRQINGDQIAMIFQEPMSSLNPMLTIGRQITETIIRHQKVSKQEALEQAIKLLELVGIPNARQRVKDYPFQLSGGQRQRVMIAIALSCRPALLIADEPTTALDVTIQAQILDLMKHLKEAFGMSILLITHDLGVIADMAQRVVVMYGGQVVEVAPVEKLFDQPLHPYTEGLLRAMPKLEKASGHLYMIPGSIPLAENFPKGCRFAPRCTYHDQRCLDTPPPVTMTADGRQVRCWLRVESEVSS